MKQRSGFTYSTPENEVFVYFILEAVRRQCYLNNEVWQEKFITNRYYEELTIDGNKIKNKVTRHLFEKFDLDIMAMSPQETGKIMARLYWQDKPKFTTYEEAFEFFYRVGRALNCWECILSNALSLTKKKSLRDSLLTEYLSSDSVMQADFAQKLLGDSIYNRLQKKKLFVFDDFQAYVKQGKEKIYVRVQNEEEKESLIRLLDSVVLKFPPKRKPDCLSGSQTV